MSEINRKETAYHGDRSRKARFLVEQRKHYKLDRFLQGSAGRFERVYPDGNAFADGKIASAEDFKGCGIACSVYSIKRIKRERLLPRKDVWGRDENVRFFDHQYVADYLGISLKLAHAFEDVFESFYEPKDASKFAVDFALALKPGTQPKFDEATQQEFYDLYDAFEKRDFLLELLRSAKPVVEVR